MLKQLQFNCDGYVKGCGFVLFNKIFDLRSRNLKIEEGVWSNSAFGMWIGTPDVPDFRWLDVRMHYMSASAGDLQQPKTSSSDIRRSSNTIQLDKHYRMFRG